jgi:hypothetical protein
VTESERKTFFSKCEEALTAKVTTTPPKIAIRFHNIKKKEQILGTHSRGWFIEQKTKSK